jgi:hypothetical protein
MRPEYDDVPGPDHGNEYRHGDDHGNGNHGQHWHRHDDESAAYHDAAN